MIAKMAATTRSITLERLVWPCILLPSVCELAIITHPAVRPSPTDQFAFQNLMMMLLSWLRYSERYW